MLLPLGVGAPKAVASSDSSTAVVVAGFVIAMAGVALTVHPPKRGRLTRHIAFACYLAAAELLASLAPGVSVLVRVVVGGVGVGAFLYWEWHEKGSDKKPEPVSDEPPAERHVPRPGQAYGMQLGGDVKAVITRTRFHGIGPAIGASDRVQIEMVDSEIKDRAVPLAKRFTDQRVLLSELPPVVHSRTFEGCELVGPPPAHMPGCHFAECTWLGLFDHSLTVIDDVSKPPEGTIRFVSCTFVKCELQNFTAVGTAEQIALLREQFPESGD